MVVLSTSIITRSGKAIVSRQYVEMTRMRIEGLLTAFPKLVGHSKQHTFVETDTVRYVYQPLENQMYLLLITTKTSNIVEDLGTLRLLAKVVPDVAGSLHESAINESAFELIFAFDEVLTDGGYREEATLSSIRTNLKMESHEEKMHIMIEEKKKEEAKVILKQKQQEIQRRQMQALKANMFNQGNGGGGAQIPPGTMVGFGGGGGQPSSGGMFDGFGAESSSGYDASFQAYQTKKQPTATLEVTNPRIPVKGMKLGSAKTTKKDSLLAAMAAEDNLMPMSSKTAADFGLAPVAPKQAPPSAPVSIILEEKISVTMNREGGVESCEVKGTLNVTANTDQGQLVALTINKPLLNSKCTSSHWTMGTHPKISKTQYEANGTLLPKDSKKGFPLNRQMAILRWSYSNADAAPLTINCWPEETGDGTINVNIEYELNRSEMVLEDVNIVLPLGSVDPPAIEAIDGIYKHDPQSGMLCWHFEKIDKDSATGAMEFAIAGSNVDVFFPVKVSFRSEDLLCPIMVESVTAIGAGGGAVPNVMTRSVVPDAYECV